MDATELSGREKELGLVECDLPGYEHVWIKFKTRGYPFRLRREWAETNEDAKVIAMILPHVASWNLVDIDGKAIALPDGERPASVLDNLEDALLGWILRSFPRFWLVELPAARKNSLPPSPAAPPPAAPPATAVTAVAAEPSKG